MMPIECRFESEILGAVLEGRWPERTEPELVAHTATCPICSEILTVSAAMEEARDAIAPPALPGSGRVWWLAQRRAQLEAAEIAARPIQVAQILALVAAAVLLCVYFGAAVTRLLAGIGRMAAGNTEAELAAHLSAAILGHAGLALGIAAVLLVVPAAAYLAIGRE